jgi:hypothetical protein
MIEKRKERHRISAKKFYQNHRKTESERISRGNRKRYREKLELVRWLLGNKCSNPYNLNHGDFLSDIRCLQFDHIKGKGLKDRKRISNRITYLNEILESIERGQDEYQLLCANCNWIKRNERKEYRPQKYPDYAFDRADSVSSRFGSADKKGKE